MKLAHGMALAVLTATLTGCAVTEPVTEPCATGCPIIEGSREEAAAWAAWDSQEGWRLLPALDTDIFVQPTEYATDALVTRTDGTLIITDRDGTMYRYVAEPLTEGK